jgi:septal ring factor EnvC (AmiA/AmiB activator)
MNSLVVYADFFKGYGNMVILDLSNGYHLILAGLSNIECKTGDWLEKGMILGDINNTKNNNLYMEFRFKGKTISPSKWAKLK